MHGQGVGFVAPARSGLINALDQLMQPVRKWERTIVYRHATTSPRQGLLRRNPAFRVILPHWGPTTQDQCSAGLGGEITAERSRHVLMRWRPPPAQTRPRSRTTAAVLGGRPHTA